MSGAAVTSPDADIAAVADPAKCQALSPRRAQLQARLPDHLEGKSYAMPGFRQPGPKGKMVAGYAAFANHCGLSPYSGGVILQLGAALAGFKTSKSRVLFTPEMPLPADLVDLIVTTRLRELGAE